MVLTWPLTSWFLFTGLFFILKSPFLSPKWVFWLFYKNPVIIWYLVLVLFNSHKDVVSGKFLAFSNILGFRGINWAQIWTKTFNFRYISFLLKHLISKDCLNSIFGLWQTTSGRNYNKLVPYLGKRGLRTNKHTRPHKSVVSWMLHRHKNIWTFITWQPQMVN